MSNEFFAYSDNPAQYRAAVIRSIEAAGQVGADQLAELRAVNATLDDMLAEMDAIRRTQAQGVALQQQALAVQQAMLAREVFQDRLEEFVYQFEKVVGRFGQPDAECPPSTQYYLLDGLFKQIDAAGISTAVIKGRENKAAFDACVAKGRTLYRQLAGHPDVRDAVAWAEAERQRRMIEDAKARQEREAEQRRREEERRNAKVRLRVVLSGFSNRDVSANAFTATVLIDGQPAGSGYLGEGFSLQAEVSKGTHAVELVIEKPKKWYAVLNPLPPMRKHHVIELDDRPTRVLAVNYCPKMMKFLSPGGEWLDVEFSLT